MALVNYSDSETSDTEGPVPTSTIKLSTSKPVLSSTPAFQKSTNPSEPRKIKVDLPSLQPESENGGGKDEPPAKKARTAGTFSGLNSFLPPPKRTSAQNAPKAGVSLKTSGEAAFSRNSPPNIENEVYGNIESTRDGSESGIPNRNGDGVKTVGKATKFKPLSVGNKKKAVAKKGAIEERPTKEESVRKEEIVQEKVEPPAPKPKRSLFSVPSNDLESPAQTSNATYESITRESDSNDTSGAIKQQQQELPTTTRSNPTSLDSLTSGLNLTPSQRRQLFGRNGKSGDINIAHFDMGAEYAANEQLRQAGEVVEHRAVKAIAPGKHSLQQLVNNARSQQEAMEDKWAQGRKDRGDGGARYGW